MGLMTLRPVHLALFLAPFLGVLGRSTTAQAHIELLTPAARYTPNHQKNDPCGHADNPAGEGSPATYQAGQTITIRFDEYVQHTGHFRVALDMTGTDTFVSPSDFDDFYNSPQVLLDEIADDQDGGLHEVEVTLPDTLCDPCTLQLIQVMTDDGAWGPGNDDLYFQCADIVIEPAVADGGSDDGSNDGNSGPPSDETTDGSSGPIEESSDDSSGCACNVQPQRSALATLWFTLALLGVRRRRRRQGSH